MNKLTNKNFWHPYSRESNLVQPKHLGKKKKKQNYI